METRRILRATSIDAQCSLAVTPKTPYPKKLLLLILESHDHLLDLPIVANFASYFVSSFPYASEPPINATTGRSVLCSIALVESSPGQTLSWILSSDRRPIVLASERLRSLM